MKLINWHSLHCKIEPKGAGADAVAAAAVAVLKRRKPWSKSWSATTSGAYKIHQNIIKMLAKKPKKKL